LLGQNELTAEGLKYAYKKLHAFIGLASTPHVGLTIIVSPQWMFLATIQNPYHLETQLNLPGSTLENGIAVFLDGFAYAGIFNLQTVV
jgi:hypothetical protein